MCTPSSFCIPLISFACVWAAIGNRLFLIWTFARICLHFLCCRLCDLIQGYRLLWFRGNNACNRFQHKNKGFEKIIVIQHNGISQFLSLKSWAENAKATLTDPSLPAKFSYYLQVSTEDTVLQFYLSTFDSLISKWKIVLAFFGFPHWNSFKC